MKKQADHRIKNKRTTSSREKTRAQRQAQRVAQVRRQKRILAALCVLFISALAALLILTTKGKEPRYEINAACRSYRPQVEQVAAQYGMSGYEDLILALMMQESSGQGPDVMQSSEGAFNEKYPQKPGGITDTAYSIQCGIQELKYAMDKAGVTGPADMDAIRLALQAYNFGADSYFSYMEEHNENIWSRESAEAFAQMASGGRERTESDPLRVPAGPWAYGDQRYPEHVLRYYHPEE